MIQWSTDKETRVRIARSGQHEQESRETQLIIDLNIATSHSQSIN